VAVFFSLFCYYLSTLRRFDVEYDEQQHAHYLACVEENSNAKALGKNLPHPEIQGSFLKPFRAVLKKEVVVKLDPYVGMGLSGALVGMALANELTLISVLITNSNSNYVTLAYCILFGRIGHFPFSAYLHHQIFTSSRYKHLLVENQLVDHKAEYGLLTLLTLIETSLFAFFPWKHSQFALRLGGFPDMLFLKMCGYTKIAQSIITLACQFIFVTDINKNAKNVSPSSYASFYGALVVTLISLGISLYGTVVQVTMLEDSKELQEVELIASAGTGALAVERQRRSIFGMQGKNHQQFEARIEAMERDLENERRAREASEQARRQVEHALQRERLEAEKNAAKLSRRLSRHGVPSAVIDAEDSVMPPFESINPMLNKPMPSSSSSFHVFAAACERPYMPSTARVTTPTPTVSVAGGGGYRDNGARFPPPLPPKVAQEAAHKPSQLTSSIQANGAAAEPKARREAIDL